MQAHFEVDNDAEPASQDLPRAARDPAVSRLKTAGIIFRSLLLLMLFLLAARVGAPQHVGRTWYDIPIGDVIRAALAAAFCVWMLVEVFILPRDPAAYRIWVYLGVILVPLGAMCLIAVW
jgi:hypothetical protein